MISSLRTKSLLVFAGAMILTLAFYVQLSTTLFRHDKNDFVQEAALTRSSSLAYLIQSQIESAQNMERQFFNLERKNPDIVQEFLDQDMYSLAFFILEKSIIKKESPTYVNEYEDEIQVNIIKKHIHRRLRSDPQLPFKQVDTIPARLLLNLNLLQDKDFIITSGMQLFGVPSLVLVSYHREENLYSALLLDLQLLAGQFESDGLFKNSLWNSQAEIIIKGGQFNDKEFLSKTFSSHEVTGVHLYGDGQDKALLSHSKLKEMGLIVISEMQTAKAYKMDRILMRKSLLYGILALCIAAMAALFLTSAPLARLRLIGIHLKDWEEQGSYRPFTTESQDEVSDLMKQLNILHGKIDGKMDIELKTRIEKLKLEESKDFNNALVQMLFPLQSAIYRGSEVSGHFRASTRYSGAWWFHKSMPKCQLYFICESKFHGVNAALEMSRLLGVLSQTYNWEGILPSHILANMNQALNQGSSSVKAFLAFYYPDKLELTFANAGHVTPVLFHDSSPTELAGISPNEGMPLGHDADSVYKDKVLILKKADHVFFYSESTSQHNDPKKVPLGQRGLLSLLVQTHKKSHNLQDQILHLAGAIHQKVGRAGPENDLLFFKIKIL